MTQINGHTGGSGGTEQAKSANIHTDSKLGRIFLVADSAILWPTIFGVTTHTPEGVGVAGSDRGSFLRLTGYENRVMCVIC